MGGVRLADKPGVRQFHEKATRKAQRGQRTSAFWPCVRVLVRIDGEACQELRIGAKLCQLVRGRYGFESRLRFRLVLGATGFTLGGKRF